jgi:hypothetical protein
MTTTRSGEVDMISKNSDTTYTKSLTITPDNPRVDVRFFKNSLFCSKLQLYLSQKFDITCSISRDEQKVILSLVGMKQNVKASRDSIKDLFESTQSKIYNSEDTDRESKIFNIKISIFHSFISQLSIGRIIFSPM